MEEKILDVKLVKKGADGLIIDLEETGVCPSDNKRNGHNCAHPDLIKALQGLRPHLAVLGGFVEVKKVAKVPEKEMDLYFVTGYSLGGKEGMEGVTVKGYRKNPWGGVTTLNPFILFEMSEDKAYPLIGDIQGKMKEIEKEVVLYFKEGKRGDPELDFGKKQEPNDGEEGEGDEEPDEETGAKVVSKSAYPRIPPADKDAMERVKNDGMNKGETKETPKRTSAS
jgi:hypothetical protein